VIHYDLDQLIILVHLPILGHPFTKEEINSALNDMPSDHTPRPDGFNGLFMKKCWSIIEQDFSRLFAQFHSGVLNLEFINGSYITLVPKKETPISVNDYRPISLLKSSLKLVTKLLANKL
jgi:hypothetical protein